MTHLLQQHADSVDVFFFFFLHWKWFVSELTSLGSQGLNVLIFTETLHKHVFRTLKRETVTFFLSFVCFFVCFLATISHICNSEIL